MKNIEKTTEDCKKAIVEEENDCFRNSLKILLEALKPTIKMHKKKEDK